jgi:hypothetical protein
MNFLIRFGPFQRQQRGGGVGGVVLAVRGVVRSSMLPREGGGLQGRRRSGEMGEEEGEWG